MKTKIWLIEPKTRPPFEAYSRFVIAGETIPEALEAMYGFARDEETDSVRFYLRPGNLKITRLGEAEFEEDGVKRLKDFPIVSSEFAALD